ncbi:hypothetical protein Hanom_Chr12g01094591 [Helianthus anomalus]
MTSHKVNSAQASAHTYRLTALDTPSLQPPTLPFQPLSVVFAAQCTSPAQLWIHVSVSVSVDSDDCNYDLYPKAIRFHEPRRCLLLLLTQSVLLQLN